MARCLASEEIGIGGLTNLDLHASIKLRKATLNEKSDYAINEKLMKRFNDKLVCFCNDSAK